MPSTIAEFNGITISSSNTTFEMDFIENEQIRILSNIFSSYFKINYMNILQGKLRNPNGNSVRLKKIKRSSSFDEKIPNRNSIFGDGFEMFDDSFFLVDDIFNLTAQKFKRHFRKLPAMETEAVMEYIVKCCEVCWVMILQDPPLNIQPLQWKALMIKHSISDTDETSDDGSMDDESIAVKKAAIIAVETENPIYSHEEYDGEKHRRVLGSDRKCKQILYHVWPVIARSDTNVILGDQKIEVVVRGGFFVPHKKMRRKKSNVSVDIIDADGYSSSSVSSVKRPSSVKRNIKKKRKEKVLILK